MSEDRDQAAAAWAEHDMTLKQESETARRGDAAAAHGRAALERASRRSIDELSDSSGAATAQAPATD